MSESVANADCVLDADTDASRVDDHVLVIEFVNVRVTEPISDGDVVGEGDLVPEKERDGVPVVLSDRLSVIVVVGCGERVLISV